jgi:hypothetical protein
VLDGFLEIIEEVDCSADFLIIAGKLEGPIGGISNIFCKVVMEIDGSLFDGSGHNHGGTMRRNPELSLRQEIERLYERYPQERTFAEDEWLYRKTGHVIETGEVFIMGKAVYIGANHEEIVSPYVSFLKISQNGWYLHAMAGNLLSMYDAMPYHLPYVGWARRDGPIKWHLVEDARRYISSCVPMFVSRLVWMR